MQYEQTELQPIETCSQAWNRALAVQRQRLPANARSRRSRNQPRDAVAAGAEPARARCGIEPGPKATSTYG